MDLKNRIIEMKRQELMEIENAAKCGDVSTVISHTKVVEKLNKLQTQLEQITTVFESIERNKNNREHSSVVKGISPKRKGQIRRQEFIKAAQRKHIELIYEKGVTCRNRDGGLVGIGYASEVIPNKWWLGLPKKDYNTLVLLCENEYGEVTSFIFTKSFYEKYKNSFSMDKERQQFKFNIELKDGRYMMKITGPNDIYINENIDNFDNLSELPSELD
jgi:hypothetical protein